MRFFLVIGEDWGVALSVSKTRNIDAALPDLFNLDGIDLWVLANEGGSRRYQVIDGIFPIVWVFRI